MLGEPNSRGLVLAAGYQRRGAGRRGRAWIAPPGSALLCTAALPDPLPSSVLWAVPFWAALAVRGALDAAGVETILQWPNDVLANGRKIAGILCISRVAGERAWAGCGIGINVVRPANAEAFAQVEPPPAFANDFAPVDLDRMLDELLTQLDAKYGLLDSPERIVHEWQQAAGVPGMTYRIKRDNEPAPFEGTALRLLPDGSLLVDRGGDHIAVNLADARVLR